MSEKKENIIELIKKMLDEGVSGLKDPESYLFGCMERFSRWLNCVEASIYLVDKEGKSGYTIVTSRESGQRNIPFTVRAKPEILHYLDPKSKSVLEPASGFQRGVYKFEEFVRLVVPIDVSDSGFLFVELNRPTLEKTKNTVQISRVLAAVLREFIEKTEIFKLLYGLHRVSEKKKSDEFEKLERDETLAELAGSVAHLLNQPLTSLMGYVELLIRQSKLGENETKYLNKIYNESERLADVIRKIESVTSYATEDYLGSIKILKLDEKAQSELTQKHSPGQSKTKRISKKLSVFLDFYKALNTSLARGEIIHHYAFSINKMFPELKLLLMTYKKETGEFFLEYKEKGGYSSDFELSEEKIKYYVKIMDELNLKIYRFDDNDPHVITIPLVIEFEKMGIAEFDFGKEDVSFFDLILIESMAEQFVLALHKLKLSEKNRYLKDYISNLIENTSSFIFVLDENKNIRTCNPSFVEMMELPKPELEGKKFLDFVVSKEESLSVVKAINKCFAGHVVKKAYAQLKDATQNKIDTKFSLIPLPKVKNLRPEIIAIGQNITEVKQLENQVMQSEKLAYLGQMAACVAHELNNPLTSITVFTEYLLKRLRADIPDRYDAYKDKLERIYESTNRIHSFTRNLTSFAKPPEEGSSPEKLNINTIIRESILFADYEIDKNTIDVECQFDEEISDIVGFKSQLHQVFINLIGNASHALEEAGGRIVIKTKDFDKDYVRVDVNDTGPGMEKETVERVFEPFFSKRKGDGGTGLGLTIVKQIIDSHKAKIEVNSDLGKGTEFSIFFRKQI